MFMEVLVEGSADVPAVREILERRFNLKKDKNFRIHPHYPKADLNKIPKSPPDSIIGAWENLAKTLGRNPEDCIGADKFEWAKRISPYLDLEDPKSPSLNAFLLGINNIVLKILQ